MPYKRIEDQYQTPKAREMIEQLKEENNKYQCTFTTVRIYKQLDFYGYPHSGILSHKCNLEKQHKESCQCICGVIFKGY